MNGLDWEFDLVDKLAAGFPAYRHALGCEAGLRTRHRGMTFSAFTPVGGQHEAYDVCTRYADVFNPGSSSGLLLCGPVGSGKTHLAAAICNHILDNFPASEQEAVDYDNGFRPMFGPYSGVRFASTVSMLSEIKRAFNHEKDENPEKVLNNYAHASRLLVLDDLGANRCTDWELERLFEIIDYRYNETLPLIATTNLTLTELQTALGDRIADRLRSMCKPVAVTCPSQRKTAE